MKPSFLHSSTIRWQAGLLSTAFFAAAAFCVPACWPLAGAAAFGAVACATAFIPNVTEARNVADSNMRLIVLVFIAPSPLEVQA
jgi:hypothetical protein